MLDRTDLAVLDALSADPLSTYSSLGKAAGLSPSGAVGRVAGLVSSEFLSEAYARAQVSYSTVGLEPFLVFIESRYYGWSAVERALDAHPYTQLRLRCMGASNGFFAVFSIPSGTKMLLLEFLNGLKRSKAIESYEAIGLISDWGHSETRFMLFDPVKKGWAFEWSGWEEGVSASSPSLDPPKRPPPGGLDAVDIRILRALSMDSKKERMSIAKELGIPDYELSRRLKSLAQHGAVSYHRLVHETGILGIEMTVIVRCKAPLDITGKFVNAASMLPYQGSIYPAEDGFVVLLNMPSKEVSKLAEVLQKYCETVDIMWGDYASSMKYFFDNDPSNFKDGAWDSGRVYMVDSPLQAADEPLGKGGADLRQTQIGGGRTLQNPKKMHYPPEGSSTP